MRRFQILCVTMHQTDFSKIQDMNIHADVVFANQADTTAFTHTAFDGHTADMITTETRGVGKNRNLSLTYADAEICLFGDDDMVYDNAVEEKVLREFDAHPDADVMFFNIDGGEGARKQLVNTETKKCGRFARMPYGGCRIAFRLNAVRKANVWFTALFGGGCLFPSGEDSMWINDARRKGLVCYTSRETIGKIRFEGSSWFTGRDEQHFYGRGAFYQASHASLIHLWMLYYAWRAKAGCTLSFRERIKWMQNGREGFRRNMSYADFVK